MRAVSQSSNVRLQELRMQVDDTLNHLSALDATACRCSSPLFEQQAKMIREWRYIYESAVRLRSGWVCDSFGTEQPADTLPAEAASYYLAESDRRFWFQAGQGVSRDAGKLVISQGNVYVWINKGLLLDILKLPEGMLFEVADEKTLQVHFSNDAQDFQLMAAPSLGELRFEQDFFYFAYPVK